MESDASSDKSENMGDNMSSSSDDENDNEERTSTKRKKKKYIIWSIEERTYTEKAIALQRSIFLQVVLPW